MGSAAVGVFDSSLVVGVTVDVMDGFSGAEVATGVGYRDGACVVDFVDTTGC